MSYEQLQEALVAYEVHHEAGVEAWKTLVLWVSERLVRGDTVADLRVTLSQNEDVLRAKLGIRQMCTAYRSAKSTILTAVSLAEGAYLPNPLVDDSGKPRSKNEVGAWVKCNRPNPSLDPKEVLERWVRIGKDAIDNLSGECHQPGAVEGLLEVAAYAQQHVDYHKSATKTISLGSESDAV